MSQAQQMLDYMLRGRTLTGEQAHDLFGTTAPATRFSDVRRLIAKINSYDHSCHRMLCSESRAKGKKRWLEYSIKVVR